MTLAHRGFKVTLGDSYEALERSILLEGLPASEIRARFIAQFIGSGAADWLKEQIAFLKEADSALCKVHSEIRLTVEELEGRGDRGSKEFREILVKALTTLGVGIQQHAQAFNRHGFLVREFSKALGGEPLSPPLTIVMDEWKAELRQMATTAGDGTELRKKLVGISQSIGVPQSSPTLQ